MSLTGPDFWAPERGGVMPTAAGQKCFGCGERIRRDPGWTWAGETGQVFFHVGCASDLAARIFHDVVVWQKTSGRRFHEMDKR